MWLLGGSAIGRHSGLTSRHAELPEPLFVELDSQPRPVRHSTRPSTSRIGA